MLGANVPSPVRLELTMALARELGVFDAPGVSLAVPGPASDALPELQHDPAYIAAVRCAGPMAPPPDPAFGLGTIDNPVFAGMHDTSALVVGASVAAASAVWGAWPGTPPTWPAACITRCPPRPAGSACTTIP
jgi:acetoin utilization protein AcuC